MADETDRFNELYERYFDHVERYVRRRLVAAVVLDVVAEVYVVVWRRIDDVPAREPLAWLYGVARRVVANELRAQRRELRLTERIAYDVLGTHHASAGDLSEMLGERLALATAFERLAESDREVLRLIMWEGLRRHEMATVLNCTTTSAAMRLSRARRRLRRELERASADTSATVAQVGMLPGGQKVEQ